MCPFCLSTFALIAAGAGSAGGLAAVVAKTIHKKPAARGNSHDSPAALSANEEEAR